MPEIPRSSSLNRSQPSGIDMCSALKILGCVVLVFTTVSTDEREKRGLIDLGGPWQYQNNWNPRPTLNDGGVTRYEVQRLNNLNEGVSPNGQANNQARPISEYYNLGQKQEGNIDLSSLSNEEERPLDVQTQQRQQELSYRNINQGPIYRIPNQKEGLTSLNVRPLESDSLINNYQIGGGRLSRQQSDEFNAQLFRINRAKQILASAIQQEDIRSGPGLNLDSVRYIRGPVGGQREPSTPSLKEGNTEQLSLGQNRVTLGGRPLATRYQPYVNDAESRQQAPGTLLDQPQRVLGQAQRDLHSYSELNGRILRVEQSNPSIEELLNEQRARNTLVRNPVEVSNKRGINQNSALSNGGYGRWRF